MKREELTDEKDEKMKWVTACIHDLQRRVQVLEEKLVFIEDKEDKNFENIRDLRMELNVRY